MHILKRSESGGIFMRKIWKIGPGEKKIWMLVFLTGFVLGISLICLFPDVLVAQSGFLDPDSLTGLYETEPDRNGLFLYCIRQRFEMAAFLVLLSAAGLGGLGAWVWCGGCGLGSGMMLTALSWRYGMKGLFFFVSCLLPHQLLLIPGFLMLICWCVHRMEKRRIFLPLTAIACGCLVEGYISPLAVRFVLMIF